MLETLKKEVLAANLKLAYACQLVGYQTPHSAFKFRDYTKCVEANFPNIEVINDVD